MANSRRDKKNRILRNNESVRNDGRYQFKYMIGDKAHFVYSWRLEPTDPLPKGKRPCKSLRELEMDLGREMNQQLDYMESQITVCELVDRYLKTKTGVKPSTKTGYKTVTNLLAKKEFGRRMIRNVKTSDAKLFLISLQQDDKKSYSSIHSIRGVLRPAFQMAVDDDILLKNPFGFELASVLINDTIRREAVTPKQMRQFLKFIKDDNVYYKYYEVV
ncbi:MAG: integrase DNA-binding domain-containing protein, partial [Parasporobacterium sp.]|nr:integrase DNA-binding domain-containing protein [Parasporobacterium sp.]